ncbi:MAG: hypothetical protein NT027_17350 [Proteobacteria bacterium]|nr:hypothetical protein [Pseudomonadota bacterium]
MKDDRHSDIKMIIEGGTNRRIFEKWSMGHIDETASAETTGQVLKAIDQLAQSPGELRGTILKILIACSSKSHTSRAS